jgi:hypothetical protein
MAVVMKSGHHEIQAHNFWTLDLLEFFFCDILFLIYIDATSPDDCVTWALFPDCTQAWGNESLRLTFDLTVSYSCEH